ncbi:MAG TPA: hypothetical protein VGQ36_08135 [Thermoanaerobaculia bacterium]|jgi:hypothetical protein|nr:hypothetical protein [Thermoanaerobaculia bacterium]
MRTVVAILCVLMFGCAETRRMEPLPVPDREKIPDNTGYVQNDEFVAGPPLKGLAFAPSEGNCAPERKPVTFTACCGGSPCNGHCVYADDGKTTCSCFGLAGGCSQGFVCSKVAQKCVKEDEPKVK